MQDERNKMEFVNYYTDDRIGYIVLNRPDKRNALNSEVVRQLQAAFQQAEADEACKVIVLKANGDVFCAGADMDYIQTLAANSYTENLNDSTQFMELFKQIYNLKKVVIAQVHGPAIAGGCGLATVCDITFAVPEATFGYTEVRIGFVPAIMSVFLVRKIGEGKTKQLLLSGDLISAAEAQALSLINFVVPTQDLERAVLTFARKLCLDNSALSLTLTKEIISHVQTMSLEDGLKYAAEQNAFARSTPDCQRGMAAFLEKKKIYW